MKIILKLTILASLFACNKQNDEILAPTPVEYQQVELGHFFNDSVVKFEVIENPTSRNPLCAKVVFKTSKGVTVKTKVYGALPLEHTFGTKALKHEIPVVGLYANAENKIDITLIDSLGNYATKQFTVYTPKLKDYVPDIEVTKANISKMQQGWHFAEISIGNNGVFMSTPLIFDHNGDIRWICYFSDWETMRWTFEVENGRLRAGINGFMCYYDWYGTETGRKIEYLVPYVNTSLHHDLQRGYGDNYVALVESFEARTMIKNGVQMPIVEDYIVEINPVGKIIRTWDMSQVLDVNRVCVVDGRSDWFHANSVWWDNKTQSLIISGRNQGIVKVDRDNNLKWIVTNHRDWTDVSGPTGKGPSVKPKLLTAINAAGIPHETTVQMGEKIGNDGFDWPWGQHAAMILPNGNLMCFDNGSNRHFGQTSPSYSRAVEYKIDEKNMIIQQVWEYSGKTAGFLSPIISDVDYDPTTGNRLITSGVDGQIIEVTPQNEEVFKAKVKFKHKFGSGLGWGTLDIMYRSERMDIFFGE